MKFEVFEYEVVGGEVHIVGFDCKLARESGLTDIVIPDEIDGQPVTAIARKAFMWGVMSSIVIADSVQYVGEYAFYYCGARRITIGASVSFVGEEVFHNCRNLQFITVSEENPFYRSYDNALYSKDMSVLIFACNRIGKFTIPKTVQAIDEYAFNSCRDVSCFEVESGNRCFCDLDGVIYDVSHNLLVRAPRGKSGFYKVREGVVGVSACAFYGCRKVTCIDFPGTLKVIGNKAFVENISLVDVSLPHSLSSIGFNVFSGCINLEEIWLPRELRRIGCSSFTGCDGIIIHASERIRDKYSSFVDDDEENIVWIVED